MSLIVSGRPLIIDILLFRADKWTDLQTNIVQVKRMLVMTKSAVRGQIHQSECSTQNLLIMKKEHTSTWYVNMWTLTDIRFSLYVSRNVTYQTFSNIISNHTVAIENIFTDSCMHRI